MPWLGVGEAWAGEPGGSPTEIVLRLPDGRLLQFAGSLAASLPTATRAPSGSGPPSGGGSGSPGPGVPSGQAGGPSGSPSSSPGAGSSGLPVPVVSSLFPSPSASHRPKPSGSPKKKGRKAHHPSHSPSRSSPEADSSPAQDAQPAGPQVMPLPERPEATVPPPLGPQAILPAEGAKDQIAAPGGHAPHIGPRARNLGVGLALIGTGAALFGWRIRRL